MANYGEFVPNHISKFFVNIFLALNVELLNEGRKVYRNSGKLAKNEHFSFIIFTSIIFQ